MSDLAALQPGVIFASRYRIERLLKSGGMGAVYVVTHAEFGGRFALKVMRPEIVADAAMRERFKQEAQISSRLESAFVVGVTDAGVDAVTGMPFIVMELLRGQELGELLKERGRLPPAEVVTYLGQVARALDKAHAQGIVHRDLKPENLFLATSDDEAPKIKVLDFGIAKIIQSSTHAASSMAGGTPLYMAPEQTKKSRDIGPWTDVWALGLIAYTLLVGRSYWEAESIFELYAEIMGTNFEPASVRAGHHGVVLPRAFDDWFARCVSSTPAQRISSAGEAAAALAVVFASPAPVLTPAPVRAQLHMTVPMAPTDAPAAPVPATPAGGGTVIAPVRLLPSSPSVSTTMPSTVEIRAPQPESDTKTSPRAGASSAFIPEFVETTPWSRSKRPAWQVGVGVGAIGLSLILALRLATNRGAHTQSKQPDFMSTRTEPSAVATVAPATSMPSTKVSWHQRIEETNPFVVVDKAVLQRHEVTVAEYANYLDSLSGPARASALPLLGWTEPVAEGSARQPVTWVSHSRAKRFCEALDARLPNTKDWTAALSGKTYPWGNEAPTADKATIGKTPATLLAVESSPKDSTSGIFDLFGSVREWGYEVEGGFAVVRGASAQTPLADAASTFMSTGSKEAEEGANPGANAKEIAGPDIGFRCAREGLVTAAPGPPTTAATPKPPNPSTTKPASNPSTTKPAQDASSAGTGPDVPKDVNSVIANGRWRFKACYNEELSKNPDAAGTVKVSVETDTSGKVISSSGVPSGTLSATAAQCVQNAFYSLKFAETDNNAKFNVPVVLSLAK